MKKLFITIAFVAATMFASAQLYVGGSLRVLPSLQRLRTRSPQNARGKRGVIECWSRAAPKADISYL